MSGDYIIMLLGIPRLVKCIVISLELSSRKNSKWDLKYGKCHLNLYMIEIVWRALGGGTLQLQESKLTASHFDKNAFSRMNVALAMQILSATVTSMIRRAIAANDIVISTRNKGVYNSLTYLCENMNVLIDICNGRNGVHQKPENGLERQRELLCILEWFSTWKKTA